MLQGLLLMKAGPQWKKYFINRKSLLMNGFFGGLCVSFFLKIDINFYTTYELSF